MPVQINLKGSHVITSAKGVASICAPLQSIIGKNFLFRYGKIFDNGSRVLLTNMPEVFSFFFGEGVYLFTWYDDGLVLLRQNHLLGL